MNGDNYVRDQKTTIPFIDKIAKKKNVQVLHKHFTSTYNILGYILSNIMHSILLAWNTLLDYFSVFASWNQTVPASRIKFLTRGNTTGCPNMVRINLRQAI